MGKIGVECCSANLEGSNSTLGSHNHTHCKISSKGIIHNLIAKSFVFFFVSGNYLDANVPKKPYNTRFRTSNHGRSIETRRSNNQEIKDVLLYVEMILLMNVTLLCFVHFY